MIEIIAGGDAAAGAVDAEDDGLDGLVLGGLFDLFVDVAEQPFEEDAVDLDDGDLVAGRGRAGVGFLDQARGFAGEAANGQAAAKGDDDDAGGDVEQEGEDKGAAEEGPAGRAGGGTGRMAAGSALRDVAHGRCPGGCVGGAVVLQGS